MVKRVKDMTIAAKGDGKADTKKVLSDVKNITNLKKMETDSRDEHKRGAHQVIVPDSCAICDMGLGKNDIKYYDVALLKKFMSVRGKIIPRSKSGVCAMHQRRLKEAIKRARYLALLPYVDVGQE